MAIHERLGLNRKGEGREEGSMGNWELGRLGALGRGMETSCDYIGLAEMHDTGTNIRSGAQRMDASRENPASDPPPRGKGSGSIMTEGKRKRTGEDE